MDDYRLSPHFTFFELTVTNNADLQARNRIVLPGDEGKPEALAEFLDGPRAICGGPLRIHSGYRCPELNGATVGSAKTSQHMKWEAGDLDEPGIPTEYTFHKLLEAARAGKLRFGQLILEQAVRDYGVSKWVHVSMVGTLDPSKVGQVMTMQCGTDGKLHYTLIETIKQAEA